MKQTFAAKTYKAWAFGSGTWSGDLATPPSDPGLEFTLPENRMHFELPTNRMHFELPENRMHFEMAEED